MIPCAIIGIGHTQFGKHLDRSLKSLAGEAIGAALADAELAPSDIDVAFVANAMAAVTTGQVSIVGQTVLRANGFSAIPTFNIDNACASSSSALHLAVAYLSSGAAKTALVVGVEKLYAAERWRAYRALNGAADLDFVETVGIDVDAESVFMKAVYPKRLKRYDARYGLDPVRLAEIAVKNRNHALENPVAQIRKPLTIDEVLAAKPILPPLTAGMCAPIGDGATAVVLTAQSQGAARRPVWIKGSAVAMGSEPGVEPTTVERAAHAAYRAAGVDPSDIDVAEVHDATAFTELLAYEELGFCARGEGQRLVAEGKTQRGGSIPVNPSGGLESRGHPVAASGLAQIIELVLQLRGEAGERQVEGARLALAESAGGFAGGDTAAVAVTILAQERGA